MNTTDAEIDKMRGDISSLCSSIWSDGFDAEGPDDKDFCHEMAMIDDILEGLYEPPKPTGNPIAFKRPCSTCGHQGNIMDKYCGSCGIEHLNWIPKSAECKNRVQVCPECNIDMYQDLSTKNAGLWVWYCPECGQEIKIT